MRKFFDRLVGLAKKGWQKLTHNPVTEKATELYAKALLRSSVPILNWAYASSERRAEFFNRPWPRQILSWSWSVACVPLIPIYAVFDYSKTVWSYGVVLPAKVIAFGALRLVGAVLFVLAVLWAGLSVAFTFALSGVMWVANTFRHAAVTSFRWAFHKAAEDRDSASPRRLTRYAPYREVAAFYLGGLLKLHAGGARLCRKVIGDNLCTWLVEQISDLVAALHPATYDYWYADGLPYDIPSSTFGMYIVDGREQDDEAEPSEEEKSAAFFTNAGFILIATDAPAKTDADIFNEYVRERWANLHAAEIATDNFGRTWVVPFKNEPLFKDQDASLHQEVPRVYADKELGWMDETDPVAKSFKYGRHWAAALVDQDNAILDDQQTRVRERSLLYAKVRGHNNGLLTEHVLRGFDEFFSSVAATH